MAVQTVELLGLRVHCSRRIDFGIVVATCTKLQCHHDVIETQVCAQLLMNKWMDESIEWMEKWLSKRVNDGVNE